MAKRLQVIISEEEEVLFRSEARRESKSLSAWMRDAARKLLAEKRDLPPLQNQAALIDFFKEISVEEDLQEPDWESHKRLITESIKKDLPDNDLC